MRLVLDTKNLALYAGSIAGLVKPLLHAWVSLRPDICFVLVGQAWESRVLTDLPNASIMSWISPRRCRGNCAIHRMRLASAANAKRIFSAGLSLLGVLVVVSAMLLWTFSGKVSAWMAQVWGAKSDEVILSLLPWLIFYMGLFAWSEMRTSVLLRLDRAVFEAVVRLVSATVFLALLLAGGALMGTMPI